MKKDKTESEVCFNCKHKCGVECTLFVELIEDNCSCFMYDKR